MNDIFKEVQSVINDQIYMVGGSVRDIILGRKPKDYDFCTPLSPDEIEAKVKEAGKRAYLTGKRFGTIGFKCQGQLVEVTTFRSERYNPGSRKPEVEFVSELWADLARRDFTINAIALDAEGTYRDPFGGKLDILEKKIKAVGQAKDRFNDDPLRMLRAARFASQLDFAIDPNLIGIIRKMGVKILSVSRERWIQELDKLLIGDNPELGLQILNRSYLLKYMLPELWLEFKLPFLYDETIDNLVKAEKNPDNRWAALLLTIGKVFSNESGIVYDYDITFKEFNQVGAEVARGICSRLKFSNARTKLVLESIEKQRL